MMLHRPQGSLSELQGKEESRKAIERIIQSILVYARTLGTPTKMALLSADSRMTAALFAASAALVRVSASMGFDLVTNRYKYSTAEGRFVVNSVQVW